MAANENTNNASAVVAAFSRGAFFGMGGRG
jgi:hypothetical protein